jgi:hypothetical protein
VRRRDIEPDTVYRVDVGRDRWNTSVRYVLTTHEPHKDIWRFPRNSPVWVYDLSWDEVRGVPVAGKRVASARGLPLVGKRTLVNHRHLVERVGSLAEYAELMAPQSEEAWQWW